MRTGACDGGDPDVAVCSCQATRAPRAKRDSVEMLADLIGEGSLVITVHELDGTSRALLLPQP